MTQETVGRKFEPNPSQPDAFGYINYTCTRCGKSGRDSYTPDVRKRLLAKFLCFTCDFWDQELEDFKKRGYPDLKVDDRLTIIDGYIYTPGDGEPPYQKFLGMGGRRFDIEYILGPHAGKKITCFDLWAGGKLPPDLQAIFPDNARFLGKAGRVDFPKGSYIETCWNSADEKAEKFDRPLALFRIRTRR